MDVRSTLIFSSQQGQVLASHQEPAPDCTQKITRESLGPGRHNHTQSTQTHTLTLECGPII